MIIISSDRGLCGGFNSQLFRYANKEIAAMTENGKKVKLALYGRKAKAAFKSSGLETIEAVENIEPDQFGDYAEKLTEKLTIMLNENAFEKARFLFSHNAPYATMTGSTGEPQSRLSS